MSPTVPKTVKLLSSTHVPVRAGILKKALNIKFHVENKNCAKKMKR